MRLGVRGKLFLVSLAMTLCVIAALALWLATELGDTLTNAARTDLGERVQAARVAFEASVSEPVTSGRTDAFCDQLGEAYGMRVTVIALDGAVLGDSGVSLADLPGLEDHSARPEVVAAYRDGLGFARRLSTSVHVDLLYAAVPFRVGETVGTVRVASPLRRLEESEARVSFVIFVAALIGLVIAAFMSGFASHLASRPLVRLAERARALASGSAPPRSRARTGEIAGLARSFERIAGELNAALIDLGRERARIATILQSVDAAIVAVDERGIVTAANAAARAMLGSREPLEGQAVADLVYTGELQPLLEADGGGDLEIELPGRNRHVAATVRPLADGQGRLLVMRDVTDIRRLEQVRRDFVANVSHELRTPLSVIRANTETLLDGALEHPEHALRFTAAIDRNAARMSSLVDDLLEISRLESGQVELQLGRCSLRSVVTHAADSVSDPDRVEVEIDPTLAVLADGARLRQAVQNLVDNALKYSPQQEPVDVRANRRAGGMVRLEVRDRGPGIAPRHHRRIFERFYRVDDGRARTVGGTGLGLAIVKHVIEEMGGSVGVALRQHKGSVFWIELPEAPASDPA